jgi:hypothetical protein
MSESQFYVVILSGKNEYKGYVITIFHGEWKIKDQGCEGLNFTQIGRKAFQKCSISNSLDG